METSTCSFLGSEGDSFTALHCSHSTDTWEYIKEPTGKPSMPIQCGRVSGHSPAARLSGNQRTVNERRSTGIMYVLGSRVRAPPSPPGPPTPP
ncbi:hypothetical protein J6590_105189, partial [Homalodisca vitripennis]